MATSDELIACTAYRYQRLVLQYGMDLTQSSKEVIKLLTEAHRVQPLDLELMAKAPELELILEINDLYTYYCPYARKIKDNFISNYALGAHKWQGNSTVSHLR